jgi:hypothetical protein
MYSRGVMSEKYPVSEKSHFSLWGSDTREEKKWGGMWKNVVKEK